MPAEDHVELAVERAQMAVAVAELRVDAVDDILSSAAWDSPNADQSSLTSSASWAARDYAKNRSVLVPQVRLFLGRRSGCRSLRPAMLGGYPK